VGRRGLRPELGISWAGAAFLALLLAGCGSRPAAVPQVAAPAAPEGFHLITYRAAGLRLAAPRSWTTTPESPPLVTVISSGGAVISLWRYARPGDLPSTSSQLQRAGRRLIAAALRRQPRLHVIGATLERLDGHPTVELEATEPNRTTQERVRSIHVFTPAAELVVEEYAPLKVFDRVDREVFQRVSRSLLVLGH
jgi:hypothetical protein